MAGKINRQVALGMPHERRKGRWLFITYPDARNRALRSIVIRRRWL